jgi:predicted ATPase
MITKLSLGNFKAFEELNDIELSPLTVIMGRNSGGKSSILHSLLLLKQTLDSNTGNAAILLEGKYLKYSSLSELAHNLPATENAKITYRFEVQSNYKALIDLSIMNGKSLTDDSYHPVVEYIKIDQGSRSINFSNNFSIKDVKRNSSKNAKHFLKLFEGINDEDVEIKYSGFIPKYIAMQKKKNEIMHVPVEIIFDAAEYLDKLKRSILNIKYLSPVRAMPKRAYIHYSDDTGELSEDGENSAHVFWGKRNQKVIWLGKQYSLLEAVNLCIRCVGLKQSIRPTQTGNIIYQIKVGIKDNKDVTIVDVGFGYSQVIPIVLTGLLNGPDNLMLIEQPEIHLHPSSCANLADLFLGFIQDKKRFIIETHSQDFINRLRLRVIENPELKDKINILFVEQDDDGAATVKQFRIDENGAFPEWPKGFIDESEKGAREIIKARSEKRKALSIETIKE